MVCPINEGCLPLWSPHLTKGQSDSQRALVSPRKTPRNVSQGIPEAIPEAIHPTLYARQGRDPENVPPGSYVCKGAAGTGSMSVMAIFQQSARRFSLSSRRNGYYWTIVPVRTG